MESPGLNRYLNAFNFYDQVFFYIPFLCWCSSFWLDLFVLELDQSLQGLLSFERLDRASPDLWPEQSELRFVDDTLS